MDLMTLAAKIVLDDSSYTKGISNAERMSESLAGKMSSMTVAVGNLAADMIKKGVGAVQNIIGGAMDGYADYQQLIGGVETLFKSSSDKVAAYAKKSYKTTGLSANQYMETVTSFSASLLQGLGGDTEQAAEMANVAITDMADNANKMGTDMSSIQAAYQGFAKQNYTMLDNLKLGYGGTQSEMVRLINDSGILNEEIENLDNVSFAQMIEAIHKIQEEMGITGTTAKEAAETISGSKTSLKAAWEDLLSAIGGEGAEGGTEGGKNRLDETLENFKKSFSAYMTNFIPTLMTTITNSGTLVEGIADAIADLPTELLGEAAENATDAGAKMIGGVTKITSWLIDSITSMFKQASLDNTAVVNLGTAIGDFIGTAITKIVTNAGTIFEGIVAVGIGLADGLVEGLMDGLFGDGAYKEITGAVKQQNKEIEKAMSNNTTAQGILDYLLKLANEYGDAAKATWQWEKAVNALNEVMPGANDWLEKQDGHLKSVISNMKEYAKAQEELAIEEAKKKALETQRQALIDARGEYYRVGADIEIEQSKSGVARQNLIDFVKQYGYDGFTGDGMSWDQIKDAALSTLSEIGAGNKVYEENKISVTTWAQELEASEQKISELESSLPGLKQQVDYAEVAFLTASAAIDNFTGSMSSAATKLLALTNPETTYSSGEYYNWSYSNHHAKGAWSIPYDDYPAILHRGERVLTASQARQDNVNTNIDYDHLTEKISEAVGAAIRATPTQTYLDRALVTNEISRQISNELKARRFRG